MKTQRKFESNNTSVTSAARQPYELRSTTFSDITWRVEDEEDSSYDSSSRGEDTTTIFCIDTWSSIDCFPCFLLRHIGW